MKKRKKIITPTGKLQEYLYQYDFHNNGITFEIYKIPRQKTFFVVRDGVVLYEDIMVDSYTVLQSDFIRKFFESGQTLETVTKYIEGIRDLFKRNEKENS